MASCAASTANLLGALTQAGEVGNALGHGLREARVGVEAGADGGAADGQLV
jgi:hypothetical protein